MAVTSQEALQRAIHTLGQSDPLIKLLQQVRLGRMKPTDVGLRVVTESWLGTYRQVVQSPGLSQQALRKLDPAPRLAVLFETGVLSPDHATVTALCTTFADTLAAAPVDPPAEP